MKVAVLMGSDSDYPIMREAAEVLEKFEVEYDCKVLSAHRTPEDMIEFARTAEKRGYSLILAGAGGAAHLPGMLASCCDIPVIGVPIRLANLEGMDSLLSIVQMPKGIPVACVAINNAANAALLGLRVLAVSDLSLRERLRGFRLEMADGSRAKVLPAL